MRVISGILKGKSIDFLKNSNTRPLKDSVRENVFNILKHSNLIKVKIEKSNIFDLYSGIGSFGIECISRGARKVTFVEQNLKACEILKSNCKNLSITDKSKIYNNKVEDILAGNFKEKFNIFFLDPPFKDFDFYKNIELIRKKNIFTLNHLVIIHRDGKTKDNFEKFLTIIKNTQYSRSRVIFGTFN